MVLPLFGLYFARFSLLLLLFVCRSVMLKAHYYLTASLDVHFHSFKWFESLTFIWNIPAAFTEELKQKLEKRRTSQDWLPASPQPLGSMASSPGCLILPVPLWWQSLLTDTESHFHGASLSSWAKRPRKVLCLRTWHFMMDSEDWPWGQINQSEPRICVSPV